MEAGTSMKFTKEQARQIWEAFQTNGMDEAEVMHDGMGRLRVYQIEVVEKRHPIKLGASKPRAEAMKP